MSSKYDPPEELSEDFLRKQRESLLTQLEELKSRSREAMQTIRGTEHEVGDSVDTSTEDQEAITLFQLKRQETEVMHQIEDALERIERGEYGECEECGDEIGQRRLEVKPFALLCVSCQTDLEREEASKKVRPGLLDEYM